MEPLADTSKTCRLATSSSSAIPHPDHTNHNHRKLAGGYSGATSHSGPSTKNQSGARGQISHTQLPDLKPSDSEFHSKRERSTCAQLRQALRPKAFGGWWRSGRGIRREHTSAEEQPDDRPPFESCCDLHQRAHCRAVEPDGWHVGFEWPIPGEGDGRGNIRLCLPTTYTYYNPGDDMLVGWGHLTTEQSDHLLATVLDALEGMDEALFEVNNRDEHFSFPNDLSQRIKAITAKWYEDHSNRETLCSPEATTWAKNRLEQGFDLRGILRNNKIQVDTGTGGIYYNPFRARNWRTTGDRDKRFLEGAHGRLTGEESMVPTHDHACKISLSTRCELYKKDDPLTGISKITFTPVFRLCSGAVRGFAPDDPVIEVLRTELERAFDAPIVRKHLQRAQGAKRRQLSSHLKEVASDVAQSVFARLELPECESLRNRPISTNPITIRTRHLRSQEISEADVLNDPMIQLEARLEEVSNSNHIAVMRSAAETMLCELRSKRPPDSSWAEWSCALDRAAQQLVYRFETSALSTMSFADGSGIPADERDPACYWRADLVKSAVVPETRRQPVPFGHRAPPEYYISVYGHLRPQTTPESSVRGRDTSSTRSYIPVERGRIRKSDLGCESTAGRADDR